MGHPHLRREQKAARRCEGTPLWQLECVMCLQQRLPMMQMQLQMAANVQALHWQSLHHSLQLQKHQEQVERRLTSAQPRDQLVAHHMQSAFATWRRAASAKAEWTRSDLPCGSWHCSNDACLQQPYECPPLRRRQALESEWCRVLTEKNCTGATRTDQQ